MPSGEAKARPSNQSGCGPGLPVLGGLDALGQCSEQLDEALGVIAFAVSPLGPGAVRIRLTGGGRDRLGRARVRAEAAPQSTQHPPGRGQPHGGVIGEQLAHGHQPVALVLKALDQLRQGVGGPAPRQAVVEQHDRARNDVVEDVAGDLLGADPLPRRDSVLGVDAPEDHPHPVFDRGLGAGPVDGAEGRAEDLGPAAAQLLDHRATGGEVVALGIREMPERVIADLMAPAQEPLDQPPVPVQLVADQEEGGAGAVALERVEDPMGLEDRAVVEREGDHAIAPAGRAAPLLDQATQIGVVAPLAALADHVRDDVAARIGLGPIASGSRRRAAFGLGAMPIVAISWPVGGRIVLSPGPSPHSTASGRPGSRARAACRP